jgi:hypothetical protein
MKNTKRASEREREDTDESEDGKKDNNIIIYVVIIDW